ncbi:type VII secretion system-associated protein [Streptomyces chartreusis]|uniref:type VII secretion system-associated protein n=1 Tax=Streptomyces chartreusis TaxID=1969 RepID=UPI002F911543|nr:type VII secretion system-associated protein [Streptomyces chartreusis]
MTSPSETPDHEPETVPEPPATGEPASKTPDADGKQGGPDAVLKGEPGFREPPEDYVKAAKVAPNHWLSIIDRHWNGDEGEPPPGWAILGRWRSDEEGEIVEWEENTKYRPSPDAYGWARPVSLVDAAAQLVATGYGTQELFALVLADAEVAVCVDDEGELAVTETSDGTPAVPVFSASPDLDEDKLPPHEVMSVPDLLDQMPEGKEVLFLSSSAPVAQLVEVSVLRSSKADLERYEAEGAAEWPRPVTSVEWPEPQTVGGQSAMPGSLDSSAVEGWPEVVTEDEEPAIRTALDQPAEDRGGFDRGEEP